MTILQLLTVMVCGATALSVIMKAAWREQQQHGDTGWIDVTWSFGTSGVAFIAALVPLNQPAWPHWRQVAVAMLVALWGLRLGLHILARNRCAADDPRYRALITQWGDGAGRRMFWFLQSQAAVGAILVLAIALAAHNPNPAWRLQDTLGIAVLAGAIVGEAMADRQLQQFKADPSNRGAVCDAGLWRWSRHPNYFFEWLAWLAYPIMAVDLAGTNSLGWLAILAPVCMYWVLVHVSGIPPLEDHMLRTRGEVFRAYQRKTSAFFPLPRI